MGICKPSNSDKSYSVLDLCIIVLTVNLAWQDGSLAINSFIASLKICLAVGNLFTLAIPSASWLYLCTVNCKLAQYIIMQMAGLQQTLHVLLKQCKLL